MINDSDLWFAKENHIPVLGHRGICKRYPENTMISFAAAIDAGVDLIEFDINITKDGIPVVIHDNSIDRTSDGSGNVRDFTLDELRAYDFGGWFSDEFKNTRIPTLREVLEFVASKSDTLLLNVEIKDMTEECVDKTVALIKDFGLHNRTVIACFDAAVLRYTHLHYPEIRLQGFPGRFMQNFTEDTYDIMFGMGIPVDITWAGCTDEITSRDIEFAKKRGILAWLFHGDTEQTIMKMIDMSADNITGNDAVYTIEILKKNGYFSNK